MLHTTLSFQTLMRLAAVTKTPILVLDVFLEFSPVRIPLWWVLGLAIGFGYLFFAIKSNAPESEPTTPQYYPPQYYQPPPPQA